MLQKPCLEHFMKFQEFGKSRYDCSEKYRYLKILKWQHKLVRHYKRRKLVSYFLNDAAKTCLYWLKISEAIDIEHAFESKAFSYLSSNIHTSLFSAFNLSFFTAWGITKHIKLLMRFSLGFLYFWLTTKLFLVEDPFFIATNT